MNGEKEKLTRKNKIYLLGIISFFVVMLVICVKTAYAYYYYKSTSLTMISSLVGDFDYNGDINMILYKEAEIENNAYVRTYSVPAIGYEFDESLTTCTVSECKAGSTGNCHYTYNPDDRIFSLVSNQKVTCKFYFVKKAESDINVHILKQDDNGVDGKFNELNYKLINEIPAYGYSYDGSECDDKSAVVNYNEDTRRFTVKSSGKTTCKAYFSFYGNSDIDVNVYVENAKSGEHELVSSIPLDIIYTLSPQTECYYDNHQPTGATIDYKNGYIYISNVKIKQTCDVFLDIKK